MKHFVPCLLSRPFAFLFPLFSKMVAEQLGLFRLALRCHSAANMAFLLIDGQDLIDLFGKRRIDLTQPFCHILMFRRDELERFHPGPDRQVAGCKCPHSHPCPLQSSE